MSRRALRLVEQKKKRKRNGRIARLCILVIIIALVAFVAIYFRTTRIKVTGNETYSEEEISGAVKSGHYVGNTFFMVLKNKFAPEEYLPFVDSVEMTFADSHTLLVQVREKKRAGAFKQGKEYMYFDLSGTILEKKNKLFDGVALVQDTSLGKTKVGKKIVATDTVKKAIIETTQSLANNNVKVSAISVDKDGDITLTYGNFQILLGSDSDIDSKVSKISEVMQTVENEYQSGTLDLTLYSDDSEIITFHQ